MVNIKIGAVSRRDQIPNLAGSVTDDETFGDILADSKPANVDIPKRKVKFAD